MTLRQRVTPTLSLVLRSLGPERWLDESLFAVNWFNAKHPRIYTAYGILAARDVFRVGGKIFFKGVVTETLVGDGRREVLLIVYYPSGRAFLDLVRGRFFQLVSPLRMLAVRRFSFVFHRRHDGPARIEHKRQRFDRSKTYALHHFRSDAPIENLAEEIRGSLPEGVRLHFLGEAAVDVATDSRGKIRPMSYETHRLVVLEGDSDALRSHLRDSEFDSSSYVALLRREL
ncbi:MAG: hypothetical protein AAGE52_21195 [Myxococcota bacterium]